MPIKGLWHIYVVGEGSGMEGQVVRWIDNKGFGFIRGNDPDNDNEVFAHISQFKKGYRRPRVGDEVVFLIGYEDGKKVANTISLINVKPLKVTNATAVRLSKVITLFFIFTLFFLYLFFMTWEVTPFYSPPSYDESEAPIRVRHNTGFRCEGKTRCTQMNSCDEAKFYLRYCPNVKIDGDDDGTPCERQFCGAW